MPREIKDILKSIKESKSARTQIKKAFKSELDQSKTYQDILVQIKDLKVKKARIEASVRASMQKDVEKSEQLSIFIKSESELLSDTAMTKFMKGETIEVKDENDVTYLPTFTVKFKKR